MSVNDKKEWKKMIKIVNHGMIVEAFEEDFENIMCSVDETIMEAYGVAPLDEVEAKLLSKQAKVIDVFCETFTKEVETKIHMLAYIACVENALDNLLVFDKNADEKRDSRMANLIERSVLSMKDLQEHIPSLR